MARSNSGLNWSNISAGFAGASNALSQGVDIKSREMLEEMKDARAENLARMSFGWKAQHDENMAARSEAHDTRVTAQRLTGEREIQEAISDRQTSSQRAYYEQLDARSAAAAKAAETAHKAEVDLLNLREDAGTQRQMRALMAEDANHTQQEISRIDSQKAELLKQYQTVSSSNMQMRVEQDPEKRGKLAAKNPDLQAILRQMDALENERTGVIRAHAVTQDGYGNPNFKGAISSDPNQPGNSGGTPSLIAPSGGGAATPNNPIEPVNQLPKYPTDDTADNTPAINRPKFPGSPPGSSLAGMPPTAGFSVRQPTPSLVGPLKIGPQLIPQSAAMPTPGVNMPPPAANMLSGITGAQPSLIPQQGF